MTITIAVPFPHAERVPLWALEEDRVDWGHDPEGEARVTLSFAALELSRFLAWTIPELTVAYASCGATAAQAGATVVELRIEPRDLPSGSYSLLPRDAGLAISGQDRAGVLYGAYELLRMQGWRWYAPGTAGEVAPDPCSRLMLPEKTVHRRPGFDLYRGFDFAFASQESAELLVWMARNRLNLAGHRHATGPLGRKLGMVYKNGGHIFEPILDPDRVTESGRTLWEEHRAWYGLPTNGEKTKEGALRTQFCVSQPDLLDHLARELESRIQGPWREADLVAVWGFDTRGSSCTCTGCRSLGNDTDQMLHLLSALRRHLDEARAEGRITHEVRMAGCAYEGTSTLSGPERPIPPNLLEAGDCIIYYPIDRSYAFDFSDSASATNRPYAEALQSWLDRAPRLPVMIGEYYNVSKFEDLPLLFTERMRRDLPDYHGRGSRAITYMHLPQLCWAVRTLTQGLYASLAWDPGSDVDRYQEEYFRGWYGPHGPAMGRAYELVERAGAHVAEWRAWHRSVLDVLLKWDGGIPGRPLTVDNDLATGARAAAEGHASARLLEEALRIVERAQAAERDRAAALPTVASPEGSWEARESGRAAQYERRLGEDRRLLRYGLQTMRLMTDTVLYHDALQRGDRAASEQAWLRLEQTAGELDGFWIPVDYEYPGPGLQCRDALSRTQLRDVLSRCRHARRAKAS